MCGVTKLDKLINEGISLTTKVGEIAKKVHERRLKWYWHVNAKCAGRRATEMKLHGIRKRGMPHRIWLDRVGDFNKEKRLSVEERYPCYVEPATSIGHMSPYFDPS